jgi:3-deoxy-D-manno-octulosonate 8-phosphate phosphatase (KDO 8-P phosphatase)
MMGTENKVKAFNKWAFDHSIDPKLCGHMGDDLPDAALFKKVGFSASVPNAPENIKLAADYVSEKAGGKGAVREIVELILKVKKEYA